MQNKCIIIIKLHVHIHIYIYIYIYIFIYVYEDIGLKIDLWNHIKCNYDTKVMVTVSLAAKC